MIAEDDITRYIDILFGHSEPGAALHHLLVAAADPGDVDAFGMPKSMVSMYAIAPDSNEPEQFIGKAIISAGIDAYKAGRVILFAGFAKEVNVVDTRTADEATENRARRMQAEGKLSEHPAAVEATWLYAACRDGRRWVGNHFLTGAKAGTIIGPDIRVGGLSADERGFHQQLVRKLVQGPPS